jgi:hypothetical protein
MYPVLYFSFLDTPASVFGFFNALLVPVVSALVMLCGVVAVKHLVPTEGFVNSLALSAGVGGAVYFVAMWLQPGGRIEMRALLADLRTVLGARQD